MTAVIYARYSSDSQREASIEGQLRDCKDYAEKNGITVVGTYIDRAYSAKTDDRPDFQRMIKDSGKKIFDVVLVWKLDRFARNRFDAVNYKYQLEKNGVHLVSAMEPISQGPEGIMVESMLIGMAEYYSAELALKVARGERENALQCKYNGGVVPLGFTIGKGGQAVPYRPGDGSHRAGDLQPVCRRRTGREDRSIPERARSAYPHREAVREEQLLPDLPQPPLHRRIPI